MKKTEFITFRTNEVNKQTLENYAAEKKWTISFLVEQIIQQWVDQQDASGNPSAESSN